jgi:hypothetical protein
VDGYASKPTLPAAWHNGIANLYEQTWINPHPEKPIKFIAIKSSLQEDVPLILGISLGRRN